MATASIPYRVTYIVDDQDPSIQYLCPVTQEHNLIRYYKQTWTTIRDTSCGNGWFKYSFNGSSVSIVSPTDPIVVANFTIQVDDMPPFTMNTTDVIMEVGLADGEHTITYSLGNTNTFPAFDYMIVFAGSSTNLLGRTMIVDDGEPGAIQYSGDWSTQAPSPTSLALDYSTSPYLKTVHWTNTTGDSMTFSFMGSSIAVYGILPSIPLGSNDTILFSIDGAPTNIPLVTLTNTTELHNLTGFPMSQLYQADGLSAGDHTLMLNITSLSPQHALGIDFIVYNASFQTVASLQNVTSPTDALETEPLPIGKIVGGVVGAVVGLLLLVLLGIFFCKRRNAQNRRNGHHRRTSSASRGPASRGQIANALNASRLNTNSNNVFKIESFTNTDDDVEKKRSSFNSDEIDLPVLHRDQKAAQLA